MSQQTHTQPSGEEGKRQGNQAPVEDAFILEGRFTMGRKVGKGYKRRF